MQRKLALYGIVFVGEGAPTSGKGAVDDYVKDLVDLCLKEGVPVTNPPTKSLTFTALIKTLGDLGIIRREVGTSEGPTAPSINPTTGTHFMADFRNEVSDLD